MKKILSVTLFFVILLSFFCGSTISVSAATIYTESYYTYSLYTDNNTDITYACIENCDKTIAGDITIPTKLGGYTVTYIWNDAFKDCDAITSVNIDGNIKVISSEAFAECENLKSVTIKAPIEEIESDAFKNCLNLSEINILNKVDSITDGAFANTAYYNDIANWENDVLYIGANLIKAKSTISGSYTIKSGTTLIAHYAFKDCSSLTEIVMPKSLEIIDACAFYKCSGLKDIVVPDSVKKIGRAAFRGCNKLQSITLPFVGETLDKTKTGITPFSFIFGGTVPSTDYDYVPESLKKVVITKDDKIYGHAFYHCNFIESIALASSVKSIGDYSFSHCYNLSDIKIGNSVTSIGKYAFSCFSNPTSLTEIFIPISVSNIGEGAFYNCNELVSVYYEGTQEQKYSIEFGYYNESIESAKWFYNCCNGKAPHSYKTTTTKATLTKNGSIVKKCSNCSNATTTKIYYPKTIKLSAASYIYNGKVKTPTVTVKDSAGKTLKKNTDYTVKYATGRKNVGKYKVTVTFKGKYSGTKNLYFTINPVKTTVKSLTAGKKSLKVAITKKSTQVTGYQIQYATNKSFKSAKLKNVTSYKTTSVTLSKLSAKKTYYVRVRTYKTINGVKYYSGWSVAKYKKTK